MMDPILIILLIVGSAIIFFATRFLSKSFKILTHLALIIILFLIILTAVFFKDLNDLRKDLTLEKNTFILVEDERVIMAVTLQANPDHTYGLESFGYFNKSSLSELEAKIKSNDYIPPSNKRLFLMDEDLIRRNYSITIGAELNQDDLLELIESDSPYDLIAKKLAPDYNLSTEKLKPMLKDTYGSEDNLKGYALAALLINYFQSKDSNILGSIKQGHLEIRPEPMSFSIIKRIPML